MPLAPQVFELSDIRAMVVLICGCCPGGNLSNILSLGLCGDMNLRWSSFRSSVSGTFSEHKSRNVDILRREEEGDFKSRNWWLVLLWLRHVLSSRPLRVHWCIWNLVSKSCWEKIITPSVAMSGTIAEVTAGLHAGNIPELLVRIMITFIDAILSVETVSMTKWWSV